MFSITTFTSDKSSSTYFFTIVSLMLYTSCRFLEEGDASKLATILLLLYIGFKRSRLLVSYYRRLLYQYKPIFYSLYSSIFPQLFYRYPLLPYTSSRRSRTLVSQLLQETLVQVQLYFCPFSFFLLNFLLPYIGPRILICSVF